MTNVARLDNVQHAALRLRRGHGARFGEAVNQVAVFASEFAQVQREYPILFARTPTARCRRWRSSGSTATKTCSSTASGGTRRT
jgi:hypothetical protein